jgi:fructose-1,6-bisphosphatase I
MDKFGQEFLVDFPTQVQLDLGLTGSPTMGEYVLTDEIGGDGFTSKEELLRILTAIRLAAKIIAREINKGALSRTAQGYRDSTNVQGELQHNLDYYANELFVKCLRARNIACGLVSEEEENIIELTSGSSPSLYIVLTDPLDGSSNIDVNIPVGTIFSVIRRLSPVTTRPEASDFLQPGTAIIAAGYVLYGSSTMLVFSAGKGVHGFTLDNSIGTLYLTHPSIRYPDISPSEGIFSINEGNAKAFSPAILEYLDLCKSRMQSARYVGSLVADFHRNLIKGGIYLYPATKRDPRGKLRLQYECNPMAFLAEQAGGAASMGTGRVLEVKPEHIHQRCPLFVGPKSMVAELETILAKF